MSNLSASILKEIDGAIEINTLIACGWYPVRLSIQVTDEMLDWVNLYIKHKYKNYHYIWAFETDRDAAWFTLKWSQFIDTVNVNDNTNY